MSAPLIRALALATTALGPLALSGQARPAASPGEESLLVTPSGAPAGTEADDPGLDREVFVYPGGDRRDPFERLVPANTAGTTFEDLSLVGVILSPDPRESVALLSSRTARAATAAGAGEGTFRLRQGVVLGDMTAVRVERECLIVEIRRLGIGERSELCLSRKGGEEGR